MAIVHKTAYWGRVQLGRQFFNVIFDTGSGNLILPTSACDGPGCDAHKKYDLSRLAHKAHEVMNDHGESEAEISFGTGDIAGKFYQDQLCLGEGGQICVDANFIGATTQSAGKFLNNFFFKARNQQFFFQSQEPAHLLSPIFLQSLFPQPLLMVSWVLASRIYLWVLVST